MAPRHAMRWRSSAVLSPRVELCGGADSASTDLAVARRSRPKLLGHRLAPIPRLRHPRVRGAAIVIAPTVDPTGATAGRVSPHVYAVKGARAPQSFKASIGPIPARRSRPVLRRASSTVTPAVNNTRGHDRRRARPRRRERSSCLGTDVKGQRSSLTADVRQRASPSPWTIGWRRGLVWAWAGWASCSTGCMTDTLIPSVIRRPGSRLVRGDGHDCRQRGPQCTADAKTNDNAA